MKRLSAIVIILLLMASCRTLGSWYGRKPPPGNEFRLHYSSDFLYMADRVNFLTATYDLIVINPRKVNIQIELSQDASGLALKEFADSELLFATNGGMYKEDRTPLGYFSRKGQALSPINLSEGYGNFYLKPNGVFFMEKGTPFIMETRHFLQYLQSGNSHPELATQSGPMLIDNGKIHRAFSSTSSNRFVRNGVGIIKNDTESLIVFAISNKPVTFYEFSLFFRDFLLCSDALYLDGHISAMYLPALNRKQLKGAFGTVIFATEP